MKVKTAHELNVPADAVWTLMGDRFAEIGEWSNTVVKSSIDGPLAPGSVRTCDLKPTPAGLDQIQEQITKFDRQGQSFAFLIVSGLPGFMRKVESEWTIEPLAGGRTRAINQLTIEVAWYMRPMAFMIRRQFQNTIKLFMREIETAARQVPHVEPLAVAV